MCLILNHQVNRNVLRCQLTPVRRATMKKTVTNAEQDIEKEKLMHLCWQHELA